MTQFHRFLAFKSSLPEFKQNDIFQGQISTHLLMILLIFNFGVYGRMVYLAVG